LTRQHTANEQGKTRAARKILWHGQNIPDHGID